MNKKTINTTYLGLTVVYLLFLAMIVTFADRRIHTWVFQPSTWFPHGDKVGHLILMGLFSFLLNSAFYGRRVSIVGVKVRLGSLLAFSLVFVEEFSQIWIASRSFDFVDLFFDLAGIYCFGWLASFNLRTRSPNAPRS